MSVGSKGFWTAIIGTGVVLGVTICAGMAGSKSSTTAIASPSAIPSPVVNAPSATEIPHPTISVAPIPAKTPAKRVAKPLPLPNICADVLGAEKIHLGDTKQQIDAQLAVMKHIINSQQVASELGGDGQQSSYSAQQEFDQAQAEEQTLQAEYNSTRENARNLLMSDGCWSESTQA